MSERVQLWCFFTICLAMTSIVTLIALDRWRSVEWAQACETCLECERVHEATCRLICKPEEG